MIYDGECMSCGKQFVYTRSVAQCMDVPPCPACGHESRKVILTAPTGIVTGKFEAFRSNLDGSLIRNQRELEDHNRRNNVRLLGEGYTNEQILKGEMGQKKAKPDKKEIAKDLIDSISAVKAGYKPKVQVADNE